MKQTIYALGLTWLITTLAPITLKAQVVPVYTDATDVCITPVSGIYHAEPSVFVSPVDPKRILVTANTWPAPDYGPAQPWVTPCVTADGGATWQCQTSAILTGTTRKIGDPASVITGAGRNYCSPFYTNDDFEDFSIDQGCAVSTDNGMTWSNAEFPYDATPEEAGVDKGHLWVDSANRLYAAWTDEQDRFIKLRFADDGTTLSWGPFPDPHTISDVPGRNASEDRGVNIQSGPSGKVYATWMKRPIGFPTPPGNNLGFARSINQGQSWPTKTYISQVIDGGVPKTLNVREFKQSPIGGGKTMPVWSLPSMTVNLDTLYLVWTNRGSPVGPDGDPDVYLIRSPDAGNTWHGPFRVNQDVGLADQWFPWITWDSATRSVIVVFYDSRHAADGAETYAAISRNHGEAGSWSEVRLSPGIPGGGSTYTADFGGTGNDYLGVHASGGLAYPVWADDRERTPTQPEPPAAGARPHKLYTSPLFVGGILANTISHVGQKYCSGPNSVFKLTVSWQTLVVGEKARLEVYPPFSTCPGTPTYTKEVTTTTTSPSVFLEMPCVGGDSLAGDWRYVVKSIKGQGVSTAACRTIHVGGCVTCPPGELD